MARRYEPLSYCLLTSLTSLRLRNGRSAKKSTESDSVRVRQYGSSFVCELYHIITSFALSPHCIHPFASTWRCTQLPETSSHLRPLLPTTSTTPIDPRCHHNAVGRGLHQNALHATTRASLYRKRQLVSEK